jgi:hypothetical protein
LKPDFSPAHLDLGLALLKQGFNDEAAKELREAKRASDPGTGNQAAEALQHIGQRR